MAFVGTAIAGSALLGAGASIYGGQLQADASKEAMNTATRTLTQGRDQALDYLDPYRQYGLNAGSTLQDLLYSPEQRTRQLKDQRLQLEAARDAALTKARYVQSINDYKGNTAAMYEYENARQKLRSFEKMAASEAAQGPAPAIEASPWYQFQAELLGRTQDRSFAARGLTGSGFEAEEKRRGLIELGAGETERQFGRLKGLYDVGAQSAAAGAGAITGTSQQIASTQQQGILGVAGANRDMAYGIANSVTGAAGMYLTQNQWDKFRADLNARNSGYDHVLGIGKPPGTMAEATARNTASLNYLQPVP